MSVEYPNMFSRGTFASITQTLPSPILEGALTAYTKALEPLIGQQLQTSAYAPQIAPESQLQQQARTAAGGLGSLVGPQAYQQFMSPYQQEVVAGVVYNSDKDHYFPFNFPEMRAKPSITFSAQPTVFANNSNGQNITKRYFEH